MNDKIEIYRAQFNRFCDPSRPNMAEPWKSGDKYFATNGHILMWCEVGGLDLGFIDDTDAKKKPNAQSIIDQNYEKHEPILLDVLNSETFLMERGLEIKHECEVCLGSGIVTCNYDHEHDCDNCDGDGEETEYTEVLLNGSIFSTEYLLNVFLTAHGLGETKVSLISYTPFKAHIFTFGKITILVMPKRPNHDEAQEKAKTLPELLKP